MKTLIPIVSAAAASAVLPFAASASAEYLAYATEDDYRLVHLAPSKHGHAATIITQSENAPPTCHASGSTSPLIKEASCALVLAKMSWMAKIRDSKGETMRIPNLSVLWKSPPAKRDALLADFGGATPISPDAWFNATDFGPDPISAGKAVVALRIGWPGNVTECRVTRSSGSTNRDRRTCELIVQRARFMPALDEKGLPRDTEGTATVTFQTW